MVGQFFFNNNDTIIEGENGEIRYDSLPELEMTNGLEMDDFFSVDFQSEPTESLRYDEMSVQEDVRQDTDSGREKSIVDQSSGMNEGYVDSTDYTDDEENDPSDDALFSEEGEPHAALTMNDRTPSSILRLKMIERTLGEIQKYISELIDLVHDELGRVDISEVIGTPILGAEEFEPTIPEVCTPECSSVRTNQDDSEPAIHHGVFNGESMVAPDGKEFSVPINYASKSRLVEGDLLKLSITPQGKMMYKQIGPAKRTRIRGILEQDPETQLYSVLCTNGRFRVLGASVTYYKGVSGDEVVLVVPAGIIHRWGAVESIIKNLVS